MPELLKKSNQNFLAASLLIDNDFCASSIHCSYYACFQKLKNVISQAYKCEYNDLTIEFRDYNAGLKPNQRLGTHEFFINRKLNDLVRRERKDHRLINEMSELKKFRNDSDYENLSISPMMSQKVFEISTNVIKKLDELL